MFLLWGRWPQTRATACAFRLATTPAKSKTSSGKYADASAPSEADAEPRKDALTPSVSLASTAPSKRACRSNPTLSHAWSQR
jgi:hypothetical protein